MVLERIRERFQRPANLQLPLSELAPYYNERKPRIGRRDLLLYLLAQQGSLTTNQIVQFADELYSDATQNHVRPLIDICNQVGLTGLELKKRSALPSTRSRRAFFLSHLALSYTTEEMEQKYSLKPWDSASSIPMRSLADTLAGDGPKRPLLKELFSFAINASLVRWSVQGDQVMFEPGRTGIALSEAIEVIFWNRREKMEKDNILMVVGRNTTEIRQPDRVVTTLPTPVSLLI